MMSMQSSSADARPWMSSRSNGVMNELFTLRMISWVASSASCSISRIRVRDGFALGVCDAEQGGQLARAATRCEADSANRS